MDADKMLDEIRQVFAEIGETAYSEPLADSRMRVTNLAVRVMGHFGRFDSYLSQGGTPPSDWAGGPDVPDEHIYVPAFDRPPVEPLGGPVPGVDGSHLPE